MTTINKLCYVVIKGSYSSWLIYNNDHSNDFNHVDNDNHIFFLYNQMQTRKRKHSRESLFKRRKVLL